MHSLWKTHFILIISCFAIGICSKEDEKDVVGHPVVNTKLGPIRGNTHVVLNSSVHVFWSIPYGKPPVGQLRFKHPVPADPWTGTLEGTRKPDACFQYKTSNKFKTPVSESEDCLYLNVFVPNTLASEANCSCITTGLSVMFFIHGGNFVRGATASESYNGSILAVVNDVIVVTVGYRLGAFGYLYSETTNAPGNAGIFDQLMALQWVHDNIECFGGNYESVTVFGQSVGAFSAGHLILSPLSHNLFHRAILMSGSPISFDAMSTFISNEYSIIEKLSNYTNCNRCGHASFLETLECLETIAAEMLDLAQESFSGYYRPVFDEHFFPDVVTNLYDEAVRKNISLILGVARNEGSVFVASELKYEYSKLKNVVVSHKVLQDMINNVLNRGFLFNAMQKNATSYVYSNWKDFYDNEANRQIASDFLSDCMFVCPANEFGHQLSDRNLDVFYYIFDYRSNNSSFPEWIGVAHGDDIPFIFGKPLEPTNGYTIQETQLSYRIVKAFGNFAKFGVPSYEGVSWPRYSRNNQTHVALKINGDTIEKGYRANECALWNDLLPTLIQKEKDCEKD